MDNSLTLNPSRWECKYNVVWIPPSTAERPYTARFATILGSFFGIWFRARKSEGGARQVKACHSVKVAPKSTALSGSGISSLRLCQRHLT